MSVFTCSGSKFYKDYRENRSIYGDNIKKSYMPITQPYSFSHKHYSSFLALVLGLFGFLTLVGNKVLDPTNIAWLNISDPSTYYLGWEFFRFSKWDFPIGLNPSYGLGISNAILYSDSNPLFAVFFKVFSGILPEPFQYFGIWLLLCFLLQAYFANRLMGLITEDVFFRLLGTTFFIFSPILNWRLHEKIGHLTIAGHFFLLAALYLCLKSLTHPRRNLLAWLALLITAAAVNSYLLMMTGGFWVISLIRKPYWLRGEYKFTLVFIALSLGLVMLTCWQVGYFTVSGDGLYIISDYFNYFRMNALGVIDPGIPDYGLWSYFLPDIPGDNHQHEGFNFLGLGFLLLIPFSIKPFWNFRNQWSAFFKKHLSLLFLLIILIFISLSHKIGIGSWNYQLSLNESILKILNIFRGHGRMFWPVFYFIYWAVLGLIIKGYSKKIALCVIGAALTIQIVDTSRGWLPIRHFFMMPVSSNWPTPLIDPFWVAAAQKYKKIYRAPMGNAIPNWVTFAAFAGKNHMATDSVYLGRVSPGAQALANARTMDALTSGKYDTDALYILDPGVLPLALPHLNLSRDQLIYADGFYVIAPGWIKTNSKN